MALPPKLEITRENLATRLDDLLEFLPTIRRIEVEAAAIEGIASHYRQIAICCLLLEADTDAFFRHAAAAGLAYAQMLERVRWDALVDLQYLCATKAFAFFDSIVAGDLSTAGRIGRRSCAVWAESDEDEVDYLRMRALMELAAPDESGQQSAAELLGRLARLADPAEDPRVGICIALHERNAEAFAEAMAGLTETLTREWEEERENPNQDPDQVLTEGYVSMEAVALVRLARRGGIATREEYPFVPSLALTPPPAPTYSPDLWKRGV